MPPENSDGRPESTTEPPSAPAELPAYVVDALESQSPERLRSVSEYALTLAEWKERRAERELADQADRDATDPPDEWDDEAWDEALDEAVEEADIPPTKGTITVKTINDNDYYYLQWRDGEQIKSQYVAPVRPSDPG